MALHFAEDLSTDVNEQYDSDNSLEFIANDCRKNQIASSSKFVFFDFRTGMESWPKNIVRYYSPFYFVDFLKISYILIRN